MLAALQLFIFLQIVCKIGDVSSSAVVYQAVNLTNNKNVALKAMFNFGFKTSADMLK